jgi:hypothetical protein
VITWVDPHGKALFYRPRDGQLWSEEREEARIFPSRSAAEASFRWLSHLGVKPRIETIRVKEVVIP